MVNIELLKDKIAQLAEYIADLEESQVITLEEFKAESVRFTGVY